MKVEVIEFLLDDFQLLFFRSCFFLGWSLGLFFDLLGFSLFLPFLCQFLRLLFELRLDGLDLFWSL